MDDGQNGISDSFQTNTLERPNCQKSEELRETAIMLADDMDRNDNLLTDSDGRSESTEKHNIEPIRRNYHGKLALGVLVITLVLVALVLTYLPCVRWIESWVTFSAEDKDLARLVIQFTYASAAGVIARWLTWTMTYIPGPAFSLVGYLGRWLADAVSTSLIVTMVLLVAQAVTIQVGSTTVAIAEADTALRMGLAFSFGFFTRRARVLLHIIAKMPFTEKQKSDGATESDKEEKPPWLG